MSAISSIRVRSAVARMPRAWARIESSNLEVISTSAAANATVDGRDSAATWAGRAVGHLVEYFGERLLRERCRRTCHLPAPYLPRMCVNKFVPDRDTGPRPRQWLTAAAANSETSRSS